MAVIRLHDVQLMIMNDCDDWRPPSVSAHHSIANPTANAAIRHVDETSPMIVALYAEKKDLELFIGESLVIIRAVRNTLGDKYADLLEWRYIDCVSWGYIKDEYDIAKTTGQRMETIAFEWIDSLGITRILAGDLDLTGNQKFVS